MDLGSLKDIANPETGIGAILGLSGLWLFLKRIAVKTATENAVIADAEVTIAGSQAAINLIRSLGKEIERLAAINANLTGALSELRIENQRLGMEIKRLNSALEEMQIKLKIVSIRGQSCDKSDCIARRSTDKVMK